MNYFNRIRSFISSDFNLLEQKEDRYLLIIICFVFSVIFVNIFVPFNINRWVSDSGFIEFLRLSSYGVIIALVLLFTEFPLRKLFHVQKFKVGTYILWLLVEIVLLSFVYIFLYGNPLGNLANDFIFSLKYTLLGICLPYSFALLIIYYRNQKTEIDVLKDKIGKPSEPQMIAFRDDKGRAQFSVSASGLLFLESADNYVTVYFVSGGKMQSKMFRNTLKNLEAGLKSLPVTRCHRSYMVNFQNIEFVEHEGKNLLLKMKFYETLIPVSQKYLPQILEHLP